MKAYENKWNYPTRLHFGQDKIQSLPALAKEFKMKRPLFVTDMQLLALPMVQSAIDNLKANTLTPVIFSNITGNPTSNQVEAGIEAFRKEHCDGVIAFGGGSAIDVAKCIALVANQSLQLWDLEDKGDNYLRADKNAIAALIAIPTTSGTGSEVGRASLIVDEKTHSKRFIFHPNIVPDCVICDPSLVLGLPPKLTAATGTDALAHNLEAFCTPGFHPMADGIAIEGLRLIKQWLPIAVKEPGNIEARANMMAAATMGATAFQKGLGAVHSLSHPVGAIYGAHHGLLNAIFMPYVLVFNREYIEEKMERLATYLDCSPANFDGVLSWIQTLNEEIGIPHSLSEIGVDLDKADLVAEQALLDGSTPTNPRPLNQALLKALFIAAVKGDLAAAASL